MRWLVFFVLSFSAHAIDVAKGKYRLCAVVVLHEKKAHLIFNPMSRHALRVDLKGSKADDLMAKNISGAKEVTIHLEKPVHNQRSVEATLLDVGECQTREKALLRVIDNFKPL